MIILSAILLIALAFLFGVIDGSFGMGYGTLLVPMLLILGYDPIQVVPAVLISQLAGGFLVTFFHHKFKNADLSIGSRDFQIAMMFAMLGLTSSAVAVLVAINLEPQFLSLYIGISTFILGLLILGTKSRIRGFSWTRLLLLGGFASFNKGLSGGGYGPIITAGQVLTGVNVKSAVAITALAEAVTCIAAAAMHFLIRTQYADWFMPILLSIGIALSSPVSALVVGKTDGKTMKFAIGIITVMVGLLTIVKIQRF